MTEPERAYEPLPLTEECDAPTGLYIAVVLLGAAVVVAVGLLAVSLSAGGCV